MVGQYLLWFLKIVWFESSQQQQQQLLPPQPKKRLYRCQVCSTSFDSRFDCLEHIQKDHNQQPSSTTQV